MVLIKKIRFQMIDDRGRDLFAAEPHGCVVLKQLMRLWRC